MSNDNTYNGYPNYETWAVNLWIDDEQSSQSYWAEQAQDAWDNAEAEHPFTREERAALDLEKVLIDEIRDYEELPELPGMYTNLLNSALREVDYMQIATNMIGEVDKSDEDEDEDES